MYAFSALACITTDSLLLDSSSVRRFCFYSLLNVDLTIYRRATIESVCIDIFNSKLILIQFCLRKNLHYEFIANNNKEHTNNCLLSSSFIDRQQRLHLHRCCCDYLINWSVVVINHRSLLPQTNRIVYCVAHMQCYQAFALPFWSWTC